MPRISQRYGFPHLGQAKERFQIPNEIPAMNIPSAQPEFTRTASAPKKIRATTRISTAVYSCFRGDIRFLVAAAPIGMMANDRVERPATMTLPRPDAAHYASRSAPTCC